MKKIFLLTLFMLAMFTSYGQVFHARAHTLIFGEMVNGEFTETDKKSVDILVRGEDKAITIYSNTIQEYKVISYQGETSTGVDTWFVIDRDGDICKLKIMKINEMLVIGIEYDNVAWGYICKLEN